MKDKIPSYYSPLFVILCCMSWMLVVMFLGVLESSLQVKNGVLPYTFNWWESCTVQQHLFLGNYVQNEVVKGTVYTTYTYPFYFVNFLLLAPLHYCFGIPYEMAQNILPYLNVGFFVFLFYQLKKKDILLLLAAKNTFYIVLLFLVFGLMVCNALPWISMLKNNLENFHMLVAVVFCILSLACVCPLEIIKKDRLFLSGGLLISLLSPIYFPAWLLCYVYCEQELKIRKPMLGNVFIVVLANILNYALPLLAASSLHLKSSASGFLYRSGLDGSRSYFDSILSVVYAPYSSQEKASTLLLIVSVLVLGKVMHLSPKGYFRQLLFLSIPFLSLIILFPQFSSIHMYFIELLLVIPCIFMLSYWMLNYEFVSKLKPSQYSMFLVFYALIIMSQLLEVAAHFALHDYIKQIFL